MIKEPGQRGGDNSFKTQIPLMQLTLENLVKEVQELRKELHMMANPLSRSYAWQPEQK